MSQALTFTTTSSASAIPSEIFALITLLVISIIVLLILRHYLLLRTTPGYLLVPVFLALSLPASIVLLVPIDLASSSASQTEDVGQRGVWLPERVLLVAWRITYWLTFALTWFILPILAEYSDAGYRDPAGRLKYALRSNAQYQAVVFGLGIIGLIYFFISYRVALESIKGMLMALAYCWGLVLAIYLMGHGLVAIPRKLFRYASISGRLRRIQSHAPRVHEKMDDAIHKLEDLEAQVAELSHRKTGSARNFQEWIEELVDVSDLPESRPRTLSRRLSEPTVNVPAVITERYLADLTRQLNRARHSRARFIDEWDRLLQDATTTQSILDAASSQRLELGSSSPGSSYFQRLTLFTPYTRYLYHAYIIPAASILLGGILALASICIIWSELIKSAFPYLSIISLTVVHYPSSDRGAVGFAGQVLAAAWISYMCAAALTSLTEVKVWRGRALVRRNTAHESAFWYAMQVAKLSIPLAYNFLTFLTPDVYRATVFYDFLGRLINLTPLGTWFDYLFPIFILVPVGAALFNLYGRVRRLIGLGVIDIEDDEEDNQTGYGTGSWREGRDLIERELNGHSTLSRLPRENASGSAPLSSTAHVSRTAPDASSARSSRPPRSNPAARAENNDAGNRDNDGGDVSDNFFALFGHRVKNTFDTVSAPKWMQEGIKKPKWMGGDGDGNGASSDGSGSGEGRGGGFMNLFGGRGEGRVRL